MLQKSTYVILLILIFIGGTSAVMYSFTPPAGSTGVSPGVTCSNNGAGCHFNALGENVNGSVTATGLPIIYTPNSPAINFSVTIAHNTADRRKWGFSIVAVNSTGTAIGTFNSTNPNAAINGNDPNGKELSHFNAPLTALSSSYVFDNLTWTPPSTGMGRVTFYIAAVAADAFSGSGGDFVYTTNTVSSPLPITLNAFNAISKNDNVLLSWQTSQEINSNYFTIQKSYDNKSFNDIGKIDASGNSNFSRNYSFIDNDPSYFEKPIYYRLAIVDKDGKKVYSEIKNVILKATATFIKGIYPNPVRSGSTLHINFVSKENQILLVKIIDNTGRLVKNKEINADKGSNILDVDIPGLAAGNYKLIIKSNGGLIQQSLLIR